jgi:hypothetical protein
VFGLKRQVEPLHLVHYLALASCLEVVRPDELHIHCHELPFGFYWDLIRPRVELHRVEPIEQITKYAYADASRHYAYAHHADFVRLDVLERWGGLYADIDTLFVRAPGDECWSAPAVIGREADVLDGSGHAHGSLSNALLMSTPGGEFVRVWRDRMGGAFDGSWSRHSCLLAHLLAQELPGCVRVEPQRAFHAFEPTPEGLRRLLVDPAGSLEGVVAVHLMAHLWWRRGRRDFIDLHSGAITERWIREADTTYAAAARRFLPDHGVF